MSAPRICPDCGSDANVRSHRKGVERILFFVKPYRCSNCNRRFFVFQLQRTQTAKDM